MYLKFQVIRLILREKCIRNTAISSVEKAWNSIKLFIKITLNKEWFAVIGLRLSKATKAAGN